MTVLELYQLLKRQARVRLGELWVKDFQDETEYEELYEVFLDVFSPLFQNNYEYWYRLQATARHRQLMRTSMHYDFRDVQYELPLSEQSIRQQLVLLRWYLQRIAYSEYRLRALEQKGGAI